MQRNTKQKTEIKRYLMTRTDHPTAEMVYMALKNEMPKLSLATVYRNLNSMADAGEILRLKLNDGIVHFDAKVDDHYHFICSECGGISDMFGVKNKVNIDLDSFDGHIEGHLTYFYGKCKNCIGNNQ